MWRVISAAILVIVYSVSARDFRAVIPAFKLKTTKRTVVLSLCPTLRICCEITHGNRSTWEHTGVFHRITLFAGIGNSISTNGKLAVSASICLIVITIITLLTNLCFKLTITTTNKCAIGSTRPCTSEIGIMATVVAFFPLILKTISTPYRIFTFSSTGI